MLSVNISDITVITVENVDYRCIITTLANLKQLIYQKVLFLKTEGIYKTILSQISVFLRHFFYFFV